MPGYDFELALSRPLFEAELDPLFQLTQGAVTVAYVPDGRQAEPATLGHAGCVWQAPSLAAAVVEVIEHVEASAAGLRVTQVETDPLLSMRDIANRVGHSIESVRLSINGARGPGGFPAAETTALPPGVPRPRTGAPGGHRLWRWSRVATWYGIAGPQLHEAGPTAQAINAWLALREIVPEVAPAPDDLATALSAVIQHVA